MDDEPRPLADALRRVRRDLGTPSPGQLDRIRAEWADVVGPALAAHSTPLHVRDGVLRVAVDDPAWAGQFKYLNDTVVAAARDRFPDLAIREVTVGAPREAGWSGRDNDRA